MDFGKIEMTYTYPFNSMFVPLEILLKDFKNLSETYEEVDLVSMVDVDGSGLTLIFSVAGVK